MKTAENIGLYAAGRLRDALHLWQKSILVHFGYFGVALSGREQKNQGKDSALQLRWPLCFWDWGFFGLFGIPNIIPISISQAGRSL
jgi:hypothetical protein